MTPLRLFTPRPDALSGRMRIGADGHGGLATDDHGVSAATLVVPAAGSAA